MRRTCEGRPGLGRVPARRRMATVAAIAFACAVPSVASLSQPTPTPALPAAKMTEPSVAPAAPKFRRLNEVQYGRAIEHAFGPGLKIPGRFEPQLREHGLLAIGAGHVTVTASGFEQYELRARQIAAEAVAGKHVTIPCAPVGGTFDAACARTVLAHHGRLLYRRPLSEAEIAGLTNLAEAASRKSGSFAKGIETGLSRLMVSPHFIFRVERTDGTGRLDDWSLASRISFLLWDSPPDAAMLDAVARGDLRDPARREALVAAMIASPRFEQGVRAFFWDMFGYDQFQGLVKDQAIYPKFNSELVKDAQEQTLRTLVDLLVVNRGDYRDIFSTRRTYINRNLAALYRVPAPAAGVDGWSPYVFADKEPRAGIMSLAAFLMLDPTHEGKSSPTIRGKTVRELLLCQPVPAPPPNVNFSIVQDDTNSMYQTARQRLLAHQESPACAGCHKITDPIGLSLENYDGTGAYRTHEKTALIDATGTFDGKPYTGLLGLTALLRESPDIPACLVQRVFEYGVGREAKGEDANWMEFAGNRFAAQGNRLPELMRLLATSDALAAAAPVSAAAATNQELPGLLSGFPRRAR